MNSKCRKVSILTFLSDTRREQESKERDKISHKVSGSRNVVCYLRDFYTAGLKMTPRTQVGVDEPGLRVDAFEPVLCDYG